MATPAERQQLKDFLELVAMETSGTYPVGPLVAIAERDEAREAQRNAP